MKDSSTGDGLQLAAQSGKGNIDVVNTGGLVISELADIQGIKFTDSTASGKISLVAKSPLTINAVIDAKAGEVSLVALGSQSTDDVTINGIISASTVNVEAGDSIALQEQAVIKSDSFKIKFNGDVTIQGGAPIPNIEDKNIGTLDKGRITKFSNAGIKYMDDYFNALNPIAEQSVSFSGLGVNGSISRAFFEGMEPVENDGTIQIEEKK